MSESNLCPECKGSGVYQGLNTVEPCRACGGKVNAESLKAAWNEQFVGCNLAASTAGFESALSHAERACQQFSGQPMRHEIEEQATEPITLSIEYDHLSAACFTQATGERVNRGEGWRIERYPIGPPCVELSNVIFQPTNYDAVMRAFYTHDTIRLIVPQIDSKPIEETVRLLSFEMNPETKRADMVFEVCHP